MRLEFVARSRLQASPERLWDHISSMDGVNYELGPWLRMTHPPEIDRLDESVGELGKPVFRSWVKLLGVLPVEYDDLTLRAVDVGRGFVEQSPLLTQKLWEHERAIQPGEHGCELVDRICHVPRVPIARRVQSGLLHQVFLHRHRRLRKRFGGERLG